MNQIVGDSAMRLRPGEEAPPPRPLQPFIQCENASRDLVWINPHAINGMVFTRQRWPGQPSGHAPTTPAGQDVLIVTVHCAGMPPQRFLADVFAVAAREFFSTHGGRQWLKKKNEFSTAT